MSFPSVFLSRRLAAKYVRENYGLRCSEKWMAKLAVTGGGPRYFKDGRAVVYRRDFLDSWVMQRISGPCTSSSDPDGRVSYSPTHAFPASEMLPYEDA